MRKLFKEADHDVYNRDSAIVYAGGKFYTGGTHNICLKKIKDDNPEIKTVLKSFLYRADVEQFQEISKHVGTVILAHLAKKEDGVFIDFGIIDGEYKDFDGIPDQYKKEFEAEFGMKAYDEMKHDMDIMKNPELNPYRYDIQDIDKNLNEELDKLNDPTKTEEYLKEMGYKKDRGYSWINEDNTIFVFLKDAIARVCAIGEEEIECQADRLPEAMNQVRTDVLDRIKQYNPKNLKCEFHNYRFTLNFQNNNDINISIVINKPNEYKVIDPFDLMKDFTQRQFGHDTVEECMEYIMNWSPEENTEAQIKRLLKKADHDVYNRDSAIVYAGGKFYTGGTHNICLKKIKDDNPEIKTVLQSFQYRADFEQFQEISNHVGTVIIAHLAKKEDGVFIDFGIIDGDFKYYDDIPDKYKKEFEDEFGMKTYDEMKHDVDIYRNPELNPYHNDKSQINDTVRKELDQLNDPTKAEEYLKQSGFEDKGLCWLNEEETIAVYLDGAIAEIYVIGEDEVECQIDKVDEALENIKTTALDKFKQHNPKNLECHYYSYDFELSFENNKGVDIDIKMRDGSTDYKIMNNSDLVRQIPYDNFSIETIDEYMEFIMDWEPPKEETISINKAIDIIKDYLFKATYDYKINDFEYRKDKEAYGFYITEYGTNGSTANEYMLFVNAYTGEITNANGNNVEVQNKQNTDDDNDDFDDIDFSDLWEDLDLNLDF